MSRTLDASTAGVAGMWTLHTDGHGHLVRRNVKHPPQERLLAAAELIEGRATADGNSEPAAPVKLNAELAGALAELPEASGWPANLGQQALAAFSVGEIAKAVTEAKNEILAAAGADVAELPANFAEAVAAAVAPRLEAAVRAGIDAELDAAGAALAD
jgi:hypothetical protein